MKKLFISLVFFLMLISSQFPLVIATNPQLKLEQTKEAGKSSSQIQDTELHQFCEEIPPLSQLKLQTPSFIALLFSFTLLGLLYGIGEASGSSSIKAFVKTEYFEAVKGAVLLVGILSIISILNSFMLLFTGTQDLITAACEKAVEIKGTTYTSKGTTYISGIEKIMQDVFDYAFVLGILAPFSFSFGVGVGFGVKGEYELSTTSIAEFMPSSIIEWGFPPQKFTLINYIINDPFYGIENSLLISIVRVIILSLTPVLVYEFLLPLGLFLRCFPILRKIGSFCIALSIGLLIIYPSLVLLIDYPFMSNIINAVTPTSSPQVNLASQLPSSGLEIQIPIVNKKFDLLNVAKIVLGVVQLIILAGGEMLLAVLENLGSSFLLLQFSIKSLYLPLNYFVSAVAANLAQTVIVAVDLLIMYTLLLDLSSIIGGKLKIYRIGEEVGGFGFLKL
jgi:hypothetical protein